SMERSLALDAEVREQFEFPPDGLMEIAAIKLWERCRGLLEERHMDLRHCRIAAVCGKGDNAGDALAMLRHARFEGCTLCTAFVSHPDGMKPSAALNLRRAVAAGVEVVAWPADEESAVHLLERYDVLLDAVLGTGVRGPASGIPAHMIATLLRIKGSDQEGPATGSRRPLILALDVPSGLSDIHAPAWPMVEADITCCIAPVKAALYDPAVRRRCGTIIPVDGIFPPDALLVSDMASSQNVEEHHDSVLSMLLLEPEDIERLLPCPDPFAYKMQRGRVGVLAGSSSGMGAAVLCVRGALAAGAGYVALFCDQHLQAAALAALGGAAIVRDLETLQPSDWDVIVAGCGWGMDHAWEHSRVYALQRVLAQGTPLVLDADGIRLMVSMAEKGVWQRGQSPLVLTPHPGEFRVLSQMCRDCVNDVPEPFVRSLAQKASALDAIIVHKAAATHCATPDGRLSILDGVNPGLGIAGAGDVLAGILAGLWARRIAGSNAASRNDVIEAGYEACQAGMLVHAQAGRVLFSRLGWFDAAALAETAAWIAAHPAEAMTSSTIRTKNRSRT
ncbi:MAG: NAD(P)H-hydrate dehydratase, partial [Spirochaetales bacterium]|nr:NAD(P)H-hydrate dehydratase [Spirochaetales bacterium]